VASFGNRVVGAIRLQAATFEEVEHDSNATTQAAIVVLAATFAHGLGWYPRGVMAILVMFFGALVGWVIAAVTIWAIGTRVLPGKNTEADPQQLMRTLGFAQAPGIFAALAFMPLFGWLISVLVMLWVLAATVIAVRQALDYDDTLRAVIVCVIAWLVWFFVTMLASLIGFGTQLY
jgi:Yip1-like protein